MVTTAAAPLVGVPQAGAAPRLRALDGLRFLAAVGVVLYHYTARWHRAWDEPPGDRFPVLGQVTSYFALAPELFFVISGFVILWTAWGRSVPAVIASRLARIFPAYWAALALTSVLLLAVWRGSKQITWQEVAVNVTLLQEPLGVRHVDGVYWTLWTELRFYLLIVILVAIGLTRRRVLVFAGTWPVVGLLSDALGWGVLSAVLVSQYAPLFAGGMLLYLIHRDGHARLPWALIGVNVVVALAQVVPAQMRSLTRNTAFEPSPVLLGVVVVACFATVAVLALTRLQHLDWAPMTALGALTYPLYLVHEFWGWWVIHLVQARVPTPVALGAAMGFSLALAWLVHHGVEKRLNPLMRRGIQRTLESRGPWVRRPAAAAPPAVRPQQPVRRPAPRPTGRTALGPLRTG